MLTPLLDPVLLHFFIHDCQLESIHLGILGEWHPDLKQTIQNWVNLSHDGDPIPFQMHFSTYHDLQVRMQILDHCTWPHSFLQVTCLCDHDQVSHDALAAELLYHAVVGSEPHAHPEIAVFLSGFRLPCRNGFNFYEVCH